MTSDSPAPAPLVTVITPTYNRASFLPETIESVLSQDYQPMEYIVLDDGSTDDTAAVLQQYRGRIATISHPNMGETRTVNKGLGMAAGEFVMVVNSDDPLRPGAISALVCALRATPAALLAYPDWEQIDENGRVLHTQRLPQYDIHKMLREFNISLGPGVLIRRSALNEVGLRRPQLRYGGDVDLWIRMALAGPLVHVPEPLATHRIHRTAASTTGKGWQMAWEVSNFARAPLADRRIPQELRRDRHLILWNAHTVAAAYYCGHDRRAKAYHGARVIWHGFMAGALVALRRDVAAAVAMARRLGTLSAGAFWRLPVRMVRRAARKLGILRDS